VRIVGLLALSLPLSAILGGENANRQSEHERGGDSDYALGHHGSPLGFEVSLHPWQLIQPLPVMAVTNLANTSSSAQNMCPQL